MDFIQMKKDQGNYTLTQEQYSIAWFRAICSTCNSVIEDFESKPIITDVNRPELDMGVDINVASYFHSAYFRTAKCSFQLKTNCDLKNIKDNYVAFELSKSDHDKLIESPLQVPRLLVVLMLPHNINEWIYISHHDHMRLKTCAYWASLSGVQPVDTSTKVIHIDKQNVFDRDALYSIMDKISRKEELKCNLVP